MMKRNLHEAQSSIQKKISREMFRLSSRLAASKDEIRIASFRDGLIVLGLAYQVAANSDTEALRLLNKARQISKKKEE